MGERSIRHRLINPANRRKFTVAVVGTGLAGASAAASLAEMGYNVLSFCIQDSARRAHSPPATSAIRRGRSPQTTRPASRKLHHLAASGIASDSGLPPTNDFCDERQRLAVVRRQFEIVPSAFRKR